jgi:hypothetical protein
MDSKLLAVAEALYVRAHVHRPPIADGRAARVSGGVKGQGDRQAESTCEVALQTPARVAVLNGRKARDS